MLTYMLYGVGFFVLTVVLQFLLSKMRKNNNRGKYKIWAGSECIIIICILGIINRNPAYFAAVIGYLLADEIGKSSGWHD